MPVQRALTYAFIALLVLIQYPLWLGKGGWLRVWELDRQVEGQKNITAGLKRRNAGMEAEVRDLKNGVGAVEERARFELGMVKEDEFFFQVLEPTVPAAGAPAGAAAAAAALPATAGPRVSAAPLVR